MGPVLQVQLPSVLKYETLKVKQSNSWFMWNIIEHCISQHFWSSIKTLWPLLSLSGFFTPQSKHHQNKHREFLGVLRHTPAHKLTQWTVTVLSEAFQSIMSYAADVCVHKSVHWKFLWNINHQKGDVHYQ